tara:strand:- start:62 stop:448 length:387 start_codon:yes stop_codon:yes gene_type:complete
MKLLFCVIALSSNMNALKALGEEYDPAFYLYNTYIGYDTYPEYPEYTYDWYDDDDSGGEVDNNERYLYEKYRAIREALKELSSTLLSLLTLADGNAKTTALVKIALNAERAAERTILESSEVLVSSDP